jgi:hypothetical protein
LSGVELTKRHEFSRLLSSWVLAAKQAPPNFDRSERGRVE